MFETTFHFHLYLFMNNNIQDEQQTYIFSWTAIYKTNNNQLVFRILQFTTISTQSARMKFKNQSLKVEAWNARSFKTAAWAQQWLWKSPKVAMMIQGPPFRQDDVEFRLLWLFRCPSSSIPTYLTDWLTNDSSFRAIDAVNNLQLSCVQPPASLKIRWTSWGRWSS